MTTLPQEGLERRRHGHAGALVLGMAACQLVGWGATYHALPAFLAPIQAELGWTSTQLNAGFTLAFVVCDLVTVPSGRWFDRHGGRAMMTLGAILLAATLVAWAHAGDLAGFYMIMAGMGAAQGMGLNNLGFAAVTANVRDYRRGLNMLTIIAGLGPSVALPVAGLMISTWGWRAALYGLAGFVLVGCALVSFVVLRDSVGSQSHETAAERADSPLAAAMRRRAFWLLVVAFSIHWFSNAGLSIHGLPMFTEWGHSTGAGIFLMALIGPAQVAARLMLMFVWPQATGRSMGRAMWLIFAASMLFLALFGRESYAGLVAFALVYGAASGVMVVARVTVVAEIFGVRGYGAISGAIAACSIVARTGAPLLLALAHDATGGYVEVTQGLAALACIGAAAFFAATAQPAPRD